MNFTLLTLPKFIEASKLLDIKYAIHDPIRLGEFNSNIKLPAPIIETIGNFVNARYYQGV
jgi:hypothetical protein